MLFIFFFIMFVFHKAVLILPENKRMVLLRLGKYESLHRPGLHIIIPFIDIPVVVNLSVHLPEWQSMSAKDVDERIKQMVLFDPDPKKYK